MACRGRCTCNTHPQNVKSIHFKIQLYNACIVIWCQKWDWKEFHMICDMTWEVLGGMVRGGVCPPLICREKKKKYIVIACMVLKTNMYSILSPNSSNVCSKFNCAKLVHKSLTIQLLRGYIPL